MKRLAIAAGVGLALGLLALWDRPGPRSARVDEPQDALATSAPAAQAGRAQRHAGEDGGGDAHDHHQGPGSHPLTAEHRALYRDVDLLDGAWRAARAGEYARARGLLTTHGSEYPDPRDDMRLGLSLLVDCMQTPSATARARAQRFYDERTHSTLRRRIRRHCLAR